MARTDRPTFPNVNCRHKVADHYHGTRACYTLDGCRCGECSAARRRYDQKRKRWIGEFPQEPSPRVDADPVRAHLQTLMDQGMGPKRIAQVSGVPHGAISKLMYGNYKGRPPSRTITRKNAETLLALTLDLADGAKVPRFEADRIVEELTARGWSKAAIGRWVHGPNAISLQINRGSMVYAGTVRILRQLMTEPVPPRVHNPTGKTYQANPGYEWRTVPATTRGVPEDFKPGSPQWLRVMRAGLKEAVRLSIERHGRVAV